MLGSLGQDLKLAYDFEPLKGGGDSRQARYTTDNSDKLKGTVEKVAYFVTAEPIKGDRKWLCVYMDAFTPDVKKCGVPTASIGTGFQQKVSNVSVYTNVKGIKTGSCGEGNIEFWANNYSTGRGLRLPGASDSLYDFDDRVEKPLHKAGYGSMQVHLFKEKQTLLAYNSFSSGKSADFGFGNSTGQTRDWTFEKNLGRDYRNVKISVYVKMK